MTRLYKGKYRSDTTRLKNYDYGSHGLFSVTINTKNQVCFFGQIVQPNNADGSLGEAQLDPTEIGRIAHQYWLDIPNHFPFVELDEFIIMPNHIHGILFFNKPDYNDWKPNEFGPQSKNLGSVIRGYKAGVKAYATTNNVEFQWHSKYYDSVVRSYRRLQNIRAYIHNNPKKWLEDGKHLRYINPS